MIKIQKITDVMQYLDGLKAVVFDLDDTLYGEKEYVLSGYHNVALILPQVKKADEKLYKAFENKKSAIDEVLMSENIYTEELKQKCLETYRNHKPDIHLYNGVSDMLFDLKINGYSLGLITDGRPEGQRAKIEALGIEKYFDKIIITDELGGAQYRKPCEKAFVEMKNHFGVEYSEICYVGDNIKKDFVAPQKLGMRSIHFCNTNGIYY